MVDTAFEESNGAGLGLDEDTEDSSPRDTRRNRRKPKIIKDDEVELVLDDILARRQTDEDARADWMRMRLERYAKYRGWVNPKSFPWPDAANSHIPIMFTDSQRFQDTIHNAVMAIRPVVTAIATELKDKDKEDTVNDLLDNQIFTDQPGEEFFGHIIEKFINDGRFTAYIPWVRETNTITDVRVLPPLTNAVDDETQLRSIIENQDLVKNAFNNRKTDKNGYDWDIDFTDDGGKRRKAKVSFYFQEDDRLEAHITMPMETFNGPVLIPKSIEDVIAPWRCGNLQPPGASNPNGASHVILQDYPMLDEILSLKDRGFYDMMSEEDTERLEAEQPGFSNRFNSEEFKIQKDLMEGVDAETTNTTKRTFTRIMCFMRKDINNDGLEEDIIVWMIEEPKIILRARMLSEMYPSEKPRRPLAEAQFLPVGEDRLYGISLLELLESSHDILITLLNQTLDNGTITNAPFGFYRPGTGMRQDIIKMYPGELYPLNDPTRDIHYPQFQSRNQTFGINMMGLINQYKENASMINDLNYGKVPKGKATALRTASATATILQQGEARPERILRRFFIGVTDIYRMIHNMNQRFLPRRKVFRVHGFVSPKANPFREITNIDAIRAKFDFEFAASLINTNPGSNEESLTSIMEIMFSPIAMQLGLVDGEGAYKLITDFVKNKKVDPNRYIKLPPTDIDLPKITAEEAISYIMHGLEPEGRPLEQADVHLQKLIDFMNSDQIAHINGHEDIFKVYTEKVSQLLQEQQRQQQLMQAAQQFQGGGAQGGGGQPGQAPPTPGTDNAPLESGEVADKSLSGENVGGGANA